MALADSQSRRRQMAVGVLVSLGWWAILSAAHLLGAFDVSDLSLLDWRFRARGERPAADSIALVAIDDETIRAYGRWPIPRDQYALVINAIGESGALATGIDLQLPGDTNQDPKSDALLAYVASQQPRLVVPVWFHSESNEAGAAQDPEPDLLAALERQGAGADDVAVPEAAGVSLPYPDLALSARQMGHITVATDRDGGIRRQLAVVRYRDRVYAGLALRMAGVARDCAAPPTASGGRGGLQVGWKGGPTWRLPLDEEGTTPTDFAGGRGSFPHTYPMLQVLRWYRDGETARLREAFDGRLVLIGLDSRKEVTEDVGATPFSANTPLLFVHANFLDNLLRDRFLTRPPVGLYLLGLALVAAGLGWLFATCGIPVGALVSVLAALALGALDFLLLGVWAIDAPPTVALLLPLLGYGGVAGFRYVFLERHARRQEADIREGRSVQQEFLPESLVGRSLSRYRIVELIGVGGMGVVYRGRDERLCRDVAVKVLRGLEWADERARRRLRNEARVLSRLSHPHIARIYDFDTQDGADFIVMEYVRGRSLASRIRRGPVPEADAADIGSQIAEALAEAHARGIVHRDLKPRNVILAEGGEVKVLDFGLARIVHETSSSGLTLPATSSGARSITAEGTVVGTLPYMAPEVMRGTGATAASDVYALGVILFEMLTGRRPFHDEESGELMYKVVHQPPPLLRTLNSRISEPMETLVGRALEKDPAARVGSAMAMMRALRSLAGRREPDPAGRDLP